MDKPALIIVFLLGFWWGLLLSDWFESSDEGEE